MATVMPSDPLVGQAASPTDSPALSRDEISRDLHPSRSEENGDRDGGPNSRKADHPLDLLRVMRQGGWQGVVPIDSATPRFDLSQNDGTMSAVMTAAIRAFVHHHHKALPLDWEGLVCYR
jgi:hypothetical protein